YLQLTSPPFWTQQHHFDVCPAAETGRDGAARITGRGDDDGQFPAAPAEQRVQHPGHEARPEILEGERRSMMQLQQPAVVRELPERHGKRERVRRQLPEGVFPEAGITDPVAEYGMGEFRERFSLAPPGRQGRYGFRDVQSPVRGESLEQRVRKVRQRTARFRAGAVPADAHWDTASRWRTAA